MAVSRVKQRVSNGGHDIPEDVIYRRYQAGINNLFDIYIPQVDYWLLADNSYTPRVMEIQDVELFNTIQDYVGR